MGKLIIVTFAFMAFAFYELSGGNDFVPIADEKRAALTLEQDAQEAVLLAAKQEREAERATPVTVPTAQVVLASATSQTSEGQPTSDELSAAVIAALEVDKAETLTAEAEVGETQAEEVVLASAEPAAQPDLREVTSARVNMRQGPGQNFNVVTKLNGGDEVEILQDPGDGWVKLRVVDSGRVGWMADFLLTAANN